MRREPEIWTLRRQGFRRGREGHSRTVGLVSGRKVQAPSTLPRREKTRQSRPKFSPPIHGSTTPEKWLAFKRITERESLRIVGCRGDIQSSTFQEMSR